MIRAPLSKAVPVGAITRLFPEAREEVLATNVDTFLINCARDVSSTCMFIWDEMVHRGVAKQPFKIAPIVNNDFKGIHSFVERELGRPPITDAYAAKFFNDFGEKPFADVVLTETYPADIHISDVEFSDNRKRVNEGYRGYRGLHVFGEFIARLKEVAESRECERISLLCAFPPLYDVFTRHGFKLGETVMAKRAFAYSRSGFAMTLKV